jgi:Kdo2-lipid IVA lauroyltransferase/acyltransferase
VGPWSRAHRVAIANVKAAFPRKSEPEVAVLLGGMWDNFGQQMAEYAFLDRFSHELRDPQSQRVLIDAQTRALLAQIRDSGRPVLFYTAHLANWELLPAMAFAHGLRAGWLFKPLPSAAIERSVVAMREKLMGSLIPARPGAAARLAQFLRSGSSVGMLADQHFIDGVDVVFFGRPCSVNPTLARLARAFECPIHGARAIRLPDGRFQLELTNALELPRDDKGTVDVLATMQAITWTVETWVREHPEQWFWMHRRWRS